MIHDGICTYEVAKLAKEKGFDEECRDFYCNDKRQKRITRTSCNRQVTSFDYCSNSTLEDYDSPKEYFHIAAPTQSLLQRWLREEKGVIIELKYSDSTEDWRPFWSWCIYNNLGFTLEIGDNSATYELALEDALKYIFENLV